MQINYANNVNILILVLISLNSYYFTDKYQFTKCILLHLLMRYTKAWYHLSGNIHSFTVETLHVVATLSTLRCCSDKVQSQHEPCDYKTVLRVVGFVCEGSPYALLS